MDWANERYVKLYTRDTTTWKVLSWQARFTLMSMMRKVDRAGIIEVGDEGIDGLIAVLEVPRDIVEPALEQLLRRKTVERTETAYVLPNFLEAQEAIQTDAARARASRERRRDTARGVTNRDDSVTNCDDSRSRHEDHSRSRNVTSAFEETGYRTPASRNVTRPSHSVTSRHSDPIRSRQDDPISDARAREDGAAREGGSGSRLPTSVLVRKPGEIDELRQMARAIAEAKSSPPIALTREQFFVDGDDE